MAGPPQIAYNVPVTDPLSQDSNVFAKVTEPVHDKFNAYQCSGSGYVMRRSALDDIGGWPLVNVGDDIVCSYLLTGAGWKCAFIEDQLQFGEAPGSLHSYVSQRVRWVCISTSAFEPKTDAPCLEQRKSLSRQTLQVLPTARREPSSAYRTSLCSAACPEAIYGPTDIGNLCRSPCNLP